jgi:hypothetical protein
VTADNTVSRSVHDLGLATWFGGSLMGAVGLNGAAAQVDEPKQRLRVATAGWNRWTPVNLAGIAAHVAGGAVLLEANKGRVASQQGVAQASAVKTILTGAALAATAWSRALGAELNEAGEVPVEGGTRPQHRHARGRGQGSAPAQGAAGGDADPDRRGADPQRPHGRAAATRPDHRRAARPPSTRTGRLTKPNATNMQEQG